MRLVFDTSTSQVSMGLYEKGKWHGFVNCEEGKNQQSKLLFKVLEEFLNEAGLKKKNIDEIAIGKGPGSYTGLRIGMTVAKTWAFARQIELYTFSSSELLEKTQAKNKEAEAPEVQNLEEGDFEKVADINALEPIYQNDHFA